MATPSKKSGAKSGGKKGGSGGSRKGGKSGLMLPVGRVGKLLRRGRFARRVSPAAAVYLTAALEYLTSELLNLSVAAQSKGKRLTPRALTLAVRKDLDLGTLLKNVTVARGGVLPTVSKAVDKKKKASKSKKSSSATPRA